MKKSLSNFWHTIVQGMKEEDIHPHPVLPLVFVKCINRRKYLRSSGQSLLNAAKLCAMFEFISPSSHSVSLLSSIWELFNEVLETALVQCPDVFSLFSLNKSHFYEVYNGTLIHTSNILTFGEVKCPFVDSSSEYIIPTWARDRVDITRQGYKKGNEFVLPIRVLAPCLELYLLLTEYRQSIAIYSHGALGSRRGYLLSHSIKFIFGVGVPASVGTYQQGISLIPQFAIDDATFSDNVPLCTLCGLTLQVLSAAGSSPDLCSWGVCRAIQMAYVYHLDYGTLTTATPSANLIQEYRKLEVRCMSIDDPHKLEVLSSALTENIASSVVSIGPAKCWTGSGLGGILNSDRQKKASHTARFQYFRESIFPFLKDEKMSSIHRTLNPMIHWTLFASWVMHILRRHPRSDIFDNPVRGSEAPDYYVSIEKPMWFKLVLQNLETNVYSTLDDWFEDVLTVFRNCRKYNNKPDSFILECCDVIQKYFQSLMAVTRPIWCFFSTIHEGYQEAIGNTKSITNTAVSN